MRYTQLTEEQTNEIETRLGISKPIAPEDVKTYFDLLENIDTKKNEEKYQMISWRATDEEAINGLRHNIKIARELMELYEQKQNTPETIKLAWQQHYRELNEYENKIEKEANRPENEFITARDKYREDLLKEIASLKRKESRQVKERDKKVTRSDEWKELNKPIQELSARIDLLNALESEASRTRYENGLIFTPELIATNLDKTRHNIERVFAILLQEKN